MTFVSYYENTTRPRDANISSADDVSTQKVASQVRQQQEQSAAVQANVCATSASELPVTADVTAAVAASSSASSSPPAGADQWFYRDPQGVVQGAFTADEMNEWFSAGYFTMTLMVRRGCDETYSSLGDLIKKWGRVPFIPGPVPPPLKVRVLTYTLHVCE